MANQKNCFITEDPLKITVLSFGSIGISTVNIAEATIHFGTKLLLLN